MSTHGRWLNKNMQLLRSPCGVDLLTTNTSMVAQMAEPEPKPDTITNIIAPVAPLTRDPQPKLVAITSFVAMTIPSTPSRPLLRRMGRANSYGACDRNWLWLCVRILALIVDSWLSHLSQSQSHDRNNGQ
jgi:hypothetical protein